MVEKNAFGADRASSDASYLDRLLFTLAMASNFGYKTRLTDATTLIRTMAGAMAFRPTAL